MSIKSCLFSWAVVVSICMIPCTGSAVFARDRIVVYYYDQPVTSQASASTGTASFFTPFIPVLTDLGLTVLRDLGTRILDRPTDRDPGPPVLKTKRNVNEEEVDSRIGTLQKKVVEIDKLLGIDTSPAPAATNDPKKPEANAPAKPQRLPEFRPQF